MAFMRKIFGIFWDITSIRTGFATDLYWDMAHVGYDTAESMCGNDGQAAIINNMGINAWYDAARELATNEQGKATNAMTILRNASGHPEAVFMILRGGWTAMREVLYEAINEAIEAAEEEGELEEHE